MQWHDVHRGKRVPASATLLPFIFGREVTYLGKVYIPCGKYLNMKGKKVRPSKKIVAPLPQENALRRKRGSVKVVKKEWNTWMYGVFFIGKKVSSPFFPIRKLI